MRDLSCDVAVIGAGTAGIAAHRAALDAGVRSVLIEQGPGGTTCARVGCMPRTLLSFWIIVLVNKCSVCALPSNPPHLIINSCSVRSPECPKGGWPRSCARQTPSTRSPSMKKSLFSIPPRDCRK